MEGFLRATTHTAGPSVAGTSLRLQKYREDICNDPVNAYVVLPFLLHTTVMALSESFLNLMSPRASSSFAKRLVHRVLQSLEEDYLESGEWKWTQVIGNTKFMNILGDFYFTETLKEAKDKSIRKQFEESKDLFIRYYRDLLGNELAPSMKDHGTGRPTEESLTEVFTVFHFRLWPPPPPSNLVDRPDDGWPPIQFDLNRRLTKRFALNFLGQIPTKPFRLISSDQAFSELLSTHTQRLLKTIGYFCSLGDFTKPYEFWRIACPETIVFENTENADGREEFYS